MLGLVFFFELRTVKILAQLVQEEVEEFLRIVLLGTEEHGQVLIHHLLKCDRGKARLLPFLLIEVMLHRFHEQIRKRLSQSNQFFLRGVFRAR